MPRAALLLLGKSTAVGVGFEVAVYLTFSVITAKVLLVLVATGFQLVGFPIGIFVKRDSSVRKWVDIISVKLVMAPMQVVILIAATVFYLRFFHASWDAFSLTIGPVYFFVVLSSVVERSFLRELLKDDTNKNDTMAHYISVRFTLFASIATMIAYGAGIAKEREVFLQSPDFEFAANAEPGTIFSASDKGFLIVVPGETTERSFGGFVTQKTAPKWYILLPSGELIKLGLD